jgi:hypothetical protein
MRMQNKDSFKRGDRDNVVHIAIGEMIFTTGGCLKIKLYKEYSKPGKIRTYLQNLKRLDNSRFLVPDADQMEMQDGRLYISISPVPNQLIPFSIVVKSWQKNPQIRIPVFIELARFLVESSRELNQEGISTLPFSPLFLFYTSDSNNPWRILVLPFFDNGIGDWALADPLNWQWISANTVLAGEIHNASYLCGCVLHYCLSGDLFPDLLNNQEKFERLLKGRTGRFSNLNRILWAALPATLAEERENFKQILTGLLESNSEIHTDSEQPQKYLEELEAKFSANRLASRWEYEGKPDVALDLLLTYADYTVPGKVPWSMIARLKEQKGDREGGLDARINALKFDANDAERDSIYYLHRLANVIDGASLKVTGEYAFFKEAFYKIESVLPGNIDEFHALQMAHLETRYLRENNSALKRLDKDFNDPWNQVMRLMIMSRILNFQKKYPSVSRLCKKGIQIINKLPDQGLNNGRCVLSYLQILDGIAHFGAVGQLGDTSYLIDAFSRFTGALDVAVAIEAEDLINTSTQWLVFLEQYAVHFPHEICKTLKIGINAYLTAKKKAGFEIPANIEGIPSIPWYDENLFFPQ